MLFFLGCKSRLTLQNLTRHGWYTPSALAFFCWFWWFYGIVCGLSQWLGSRCSFLQWGMKPWEWIQKSGTSNWKLRERRDMNVSIPSISCMHYMTCTMYMCISNHLYFMIIGIYDHLFIYINYIFNVDIITIVIHCLSLSLSSKTTSEATMTFDDGVPTWPLDRS